MTSKILLAFFVCMIAVAVEATYEESRDDSSDSSDSSDSDDTGIAHERCDPRFCPNDKECHECCDHNLHLDYQEAEKTYAALRVVVDDHCACYDFALEKLYGNSTNKEE